MQYELLYIHFDRDCFCGPAKYPEWHAGFQQAIMKRVRDGFGASPPWGGPPINFHFASAMLPGTHDCPTCKAIVAGNMTAPLVESAWPGFPAYWPRWWQRQSAHI